MAGYSETPLPKKLGIKTGARLTLIDPPVGFSAALGQLPPGILCQAPDAPNLDMVVLFVTTMSRLADRFAGVAGRLAPAGALWVAWPKRRSGVSTDLTENGIRGVGLGYGMVDTKVCAIDPVWSGLRFVVRLEGRPDWPRHIDRRPPSAGA